MSPQNRSTSQNEVCIDKHCKRGSRGHRGHRGKRGHKGHTGKTGSQGPAGTSAIQSFAEAYITGTTGGSLPFPTGGAAPVNFTNEGVKSSDINYDSVTKIFTINTSGIYTIEYNVKASAPFSSENAIDHIEIQVLVNGAPLLDRTTIVPGVIGQSPNVNSYAEATNQFTMSFAAGNTIQLMAEAFLTPNNDDVFYGWPSQGIQQMAYISIEKIG
jgi:hypothetical protein